MRSKNITLEQALDALKTTEVLCAMSEKYRTLALQANDHSDQMNPYVSKYISKLMDIQNDLHNQISILKDKVKTAELLINTLENNNHRAVLQLRYLCGYDWDEIASKLCYVKRWVYKLHQQAISILNNGG